MNKSLRDVLEKWLEDSRTFSMSELRAASGLSRQAIHRILKTLLLTNRLQSIGAGRNTKYQPTAPTALNAEADFFSALEAHVDCLRVVRLTALFSIEPNTRQQADLLLLNIHNKPFVVLDCSHIQRVGRPFVCALVENSMEKRWRFWLINAAPNVIRLFEQEYIWCMHKSQSDRVG